MKRCKQCGKEVPEDYWLPCCPAPSDCYHRHIRGLPPRRLPEPEGHAAPVAPIPHVSRLEPEEATKPLVSRRGSKHVMSDDLEGLGRRMVRWLRENGGTSGRFVKIRTMQNHLSLHRYGYWRMAVSFLEQRKVVQVDEREITLLDDTRVLSHKIKKRKRRGRRTAWFEEHVLGLRKRDGPE
jgi:hypothetical protein